MILRFASVVYGVITMVIALAAFGLPLAGALAVLAACAVAGLLIYRLGTVGVGRCGSTIHVRNILSTTHVEVSEITGTSSRRSFQLWTSRVLVLHTNAGDVPVSAVSTPTSGVDVSRWLGVPIVPR